MPYVSCVNSKFIFYLIGHEGNLDLSIEELKRGVCSVYLACVQYFLIGDNLLELYYKPPLHVRVNLMLYESY
jgi:hypothetical protein